MIINQIFCLYYILGNTRYNTKFCTSIDAIKFRLSKITHCHYFTRKGHTAATCYAKTKQTKRRNYSYFRYNSYRNYPRFRRNYSYFKNNYYNWRRYNK